MIFVVDVRNNFEILFLWYKEILLFNLVVLVVIEIKKILIDLIIKIIIYLLRYIMEIIYFFNLFYFNNELSKW